MRARPAGEDVVVRGRVQARIGMTQRLANHLNTYAMSPHPAHRLHAPDIVSPCSSSPMRIASATAGSRLSRQVCSCAAVASAGAPPVEYAARGWGDDGAWLISGARPAIADTDGGASAACSPQPVVALGAGADSGQTVHDAMPAVGAVVPLVQGGHRWLLCSPVPAVPGGHGAHSLLELPPYPAWQAVCNMKGGGANGRR